jgi:hypothetical protein
MSSDKIQFLLTLLEDPVCIIIKSSTLILEVIHGFFRGFFQLTTFAETEAGHS